MYTTSMIWALRWYSCLLLIANAQAIVNLNLKSSLISDLLRHRQGGATSGSDSSQSNSGLESPSKKQSTTSSDLVRIDLSGRIHSHIAGPCLDDTNTEASEQKRPLIWLPSSPLSFILGADYDFSKCWYGVQRWFATTRWTPAQTNANWIPSRIDCVREQPHIQTTNREDGANLIRIDWDINQDQFHERAQWRRNDVGDSTLSLVHSQSFLPQHPQRLALELHVHNRHLPSEIPRTHNTLQDDDWFLPDITINAMGHIESRNQVSFPWRDAIWGARLVIKRRLGWSCMGLATSTDAGGDAESDTWVGLDVSCATANQAATTARLGAKLENIRATAHVALRQDLVAAGMF